MLQPQATFQLVPAKQWGPIDPDHLTTGERRGELPEFGTVGTGQQWVMRLQRPVMETLMKQKDVSRHPPHLQGRFAERVHDPYKTRRKLHDPTVCPECGALFHKGRWTWPANPAPSDAPREMCQACHRIRDKSPAGWLTLKGGFVTPHRDELTHAVRHQEQLEKAEHPLHRIMDIQETNDGFVVTTTDIHLPRRIGEALHRAYHGTLDFHYDDEAYLLRVNWTRDQ